VNFFELSTFANTCFVPSTNYVNFVLIFAALNSEYLNPYWSPFSFFREISDSPPSFTIITVQYFCIWQAKYLTISRCAPLLLHFKQTVMWTY